MYGIAINMRSTNYLLRRYGHHKIDHAHLLHEIHSVKRLKVKGMFIVEGELS